MTSGLEVDWLCSETEIEPPCWTLDDFIVVSVVSIGVLHLVSFTFVHFVSVRWCSVCQDHQESSEAAQLPVGGHHSR